MIKDSHLLMEKDILTLNYCSVCNGEKNHIIDYVKTIGGTEDNPVSTSYMIVRCAGCYDISYRTEYKDYESCYPDENNNWIPNTVIDCYPITLRNHQQNFEQEFLPNKIRKIYNEAIVAFASDCFLLTAVAFRAIIEAVCLDKKIKINDIEDLKPQIDKLLVKGLITEAEAARLHTIRFLGNDSIHSIATPPKKDLFVVLNMVEHLLKNLYVIDKQITGQLETIIKDFNEFRILLNSKISNFKIDEIVSLQKLLGKSARRLNNKARDFEAELIEKINSGKYKKLLLGDVVSHQDPKLPSIQNYVVKDTEFDEGIIF